MQRHIPCLFLYKEALMDKKITELTELAEAPASGDLIDVVDISDNTMAASGTNKKVTRDNFFSGNIHTHAGIDSVNAITSNGNGTVNVPANTASFYDDAKTTLTNIVIAQSATLALIDLTNNYIVADRETGTWVVSTNIDLVDFVRYLYYALIYRSGNNVHIQLAPIIGAGEIEASFHRTLVGDKYKRVSGVDNLAVDSSLNITGDGGLVFCNNTEYEILPITTSTIWFFSHHVGGVWTNTFYANTPKINNIQFDDGVDLVGLTDSHCTINYLFRGIESTDHLYITLADQEFASVSEAQAYNVIPVSAIITHAILIGRVITLKGATNSFTIESFFDEKFPSIPISQHNDMGGVQGGGTDEKYHLTADEYNALQTLLGT